MQYDLLKVGILLEKARFDQNMDRVLGSVSQQIDTSLVLRTRLLSLHRVKAGERHLLEQMLPNNLRDTVRSLFFETRSLNKR